MRQHQFVKQCRFLGITTTTPLSNEEKGKESASPPKSEDTDNDSEVEQELRAALAKANSETSSYITKCRELEDKYKRSLADSENLRTRLTKQIQDQKLYAIQSFCKDLTDIEDILRMAIESVPKDQLSNGNKHLKELYEGLQMTEARLVQVFKNNGLTQINPLNSKFNPNEHEAVLQKEEEGKESGTVIFVSKMGYKLHERVIRPAIVGVAK
jgi:molecular chaperone GrpE